MQIEASTIFGLALSKKQQEQFSAYAQMLTEANAVMDLTAVGEDAIEARHFLDSLALCQVADFSGKSLIDIGTGAGFPGLPLKIAVPSLQLTLLDALQKRVNFLEGVSQSLGLEHVTCVHARAEEWVAQAGKRESFDYATSRAVARLDVLAELALPYVKIGGSLLAMKALDSNAEIQAAQNAIEILGGQVARIEEYTVPGAAVVRRIVEIKKVGETPAAYPRRFARIQKKPL